MNSWRWVKFGKSFRPFIKAKIVLRPRGSLPPPLESGSHHGDVVVVVDLRLCSLRLLLSHGDLLQVFADGLSTQAYAAPVEKKTFQAAVAHAAPVHAHSPTLSLGASAGNVNLRARRKGSSAMVIPRRRLRTKTPLRTVERVPSMGLVRRRMRSKGPPPQPHPQATMTQGSLSRRIGYKTPPAGGGKHLLPPGLPSHQAPAIKLLDLSLLLMSVLFLLLKD